MLFLITERARVFEERILVRIRSDQWNASIAQEISKEEMRLKRQKRYFERSPVSVDDAEVFHDMKQIRKTFNTVLLKVVEKIQKE